MKAVEHHAPEMIKTIDERFNGLAIPWQRVALYVTLCVAFFLLGFVPTWLKVQEASEQRDAAQREVRLNQLQNTLGAAVIDVQRGQYEPARQTTSDFYSSLRNQIESGNQSVFTPAQREMLKPLLSQRDDIIALLARNDQTAAPRLLAVYTSYLELTGNGG
jgi:hypothetical protein